MQAFEIHVGKEYGYRDFPKRTGQLQQVKVLDHVRSKWKVQWIDPNPGLVDYVRSAQIVVAWEDRRSFVEEEENWESLNEACDRTWPGREHPVSEAVDLVLDSTGESVWVDNTGAMAAAPDSADRLAKRAKCELPLTPPAFIDRQGTAHFSFDAALELAQSFAHVEPQTVLLEVETEEQKEEREARELPSAYLQRHLKRWRASWALCRQWAGFDQALAQRDAEIERLRRIIEDMRYELRRAGHDQLAARLDRKLS